MSLFITFEGIEGCGKSTQVNSLKGRLARRGFDVCLVREPGSTAIGRVARRLLKHRLEVALNPVTELLLFEVARSQLVEEVIRPALNRGQAVICDRYAESSLAYQGYGRGLDLKTVSEMNLVATGGLRPDLIVLPDLDAGEGLLRKGAAANSDRFEREDLAFHRRVRDGYLQMASSEPERWLVLDATLPRREIGRSIWERVSMLL